MKRMLLVLATAAAAVAGSAGQASAGAPVIVPFFRCVDTGGTWAVPAGSPVTVRGRWAATNRGLVQDFIKDVVATASVDNAPVSSALGAPEPFGSETGPGGGPNAVAQWVTSWTYQLGSLASGRTVNVQLTWVLRHILSDGVESFPGGTTFGGTCTITAS